MALGTILGALGQAFGGHADDVKQRRDRERQAAVDAESARMHRAEIANFASEGRLREAQISNTHTESARRTQQTELTAQMQTPEFENDYVQALNGDRAAEIRVRRIAGLHDQGPAILDPLNRRNTSTIQTSQNGALYRIYGDNRMERIRALGAGGPLGQTAGQTAAVPPAPSARMPGPSAMPASTAKPAVAGMPQRSQEEEPKFGAASPRYANFNDPGGATHFTTEEEAARQGWIKAQTTGAGGTSGMGQNMQARLIAAVSEGRLADERMTKFEQAHMKDGKLQFGALADIGAGLTTGLAGTHSPAGIVIQRGVGNLMNTYDKGDVVQYQRDGRLTARAEQLMAARGGSEAQASDNAYLAQAPNNAPDATVQAAQKSRRALFGELGAVVQTLTPEQLAKLNQGLAALHASDPEFGNKSAIEQTLDAIDRTGMGAEIQQAALRRKAAAGQPPGSHAGAATKPRASYDRYKHLLEP